MKKYLLFDLDGTLTDPKGEMIEGIPQMLRNLQAKGMILAVASSKPQVFVERILDHFDLRKYFTVIVGSDLEGKRESKEEVVREALRLLFGDGGIEREQVYMIGDRKYDMEGARVLQVESVGVTYGYGSMEELKEAKADYIVQSVAELEKFLLRGADDGEGSSGTSAYREIQKMFFAVAAFLLARILVSLIFEIANYQGIAVPGLGFLAGGLVIFASARKQIRKTAYDTRLNYLKKSRPIEYLLFGLLTTGTALGLNLLLELLQVTANSESYQEVAADQYSAPFLWGLLVYGLVSPAAEELLFRGIVHNRLRRLMSPGIALVLSSAIFAVYHMNYVQGIYAFLMGCLIAYAYEYFGDFKMALAVHAGANILVYCLTYTGTAAADLASWLACALLLGLAAASLWQLGRRKRVL